MKSLVEAMVNTDLAPCKRKVRGSSPRVGSTSELLLRLRNVDLFDQCHRIEPSVDHVSVGKVTEVLAESCADCAGTVWVRRSPHTCTIRS
jgi:hypothetical protein